MGNYLIPANSKKSMLIFGMFYTFDLVLFGCGLGATLICLMVLPIANFLFAILAIMPALITAFLVFPIPNYHNTLTVIISAIRFITTRQRFIWKGWCVMDEISKK